MALANFRMLIHELLKKDPDIFSEASPIIILNSKSAVCMAKNVKDNKHTMHIYSRVNFVRNGDNCKTHKILCYEVGLQLENSVTKNFGENDLNPRIKYTMVRIDK